jgi:hypothetical protein
MPETNVAKLRMSSAPRRANYGAIAAYLEAQGMEANDTTVLAFALAAGAERVRELEAALRRADALTDGGRDDPAERA